MSGFTLAKSENTNACVNGIKLFGLDVRGSTLLSDAAPAFAAMSNQLGLFQFMCSFHYVNAAFTHLPSSSADPKKINFQTDFKKLIYHDFEILEEFHKFLDYVEFTYKDECYVNY